MKTVILNFTGAMQEQSRLREKAELYADCSKIRGTDGYCDPEAEEKLREILAKLPFSAIHFFDSGNYHYMSKLFLEMAEEDFSLVMFDHHTDMQPPALLPLLSCGSWLLETLETNPHLKEVFLIGPTKESLQKIPPQHRERVSVLSAEELQSEGWEQKLEKMLPAYRVYCSVDKDILATEVCMTNWDQGNTELEQLLTLLQHFLRAKGLLGADVCGEPDRRQEAGESQKSEKVNEKLREVFLEHR